MNRYVVVHGHFYQPPRENPWTGVVERQPSAGEDHDWNQRVARECYIPNGRARVVNERNETLRVVNNYASMSFNFGPTLLSWYERDHPQEYARLLEADADSRRRLDGHGNAIAQAYNHMIMPLAQPRDQITQIRWGLADFERRFGRRAEAMWLPEAACDDATLRRLIAEGMRFAVLSPAQALRARSPGADSWIDVGDGAIDTRRPYRWWSGAPGESDFIDLFFYDGALSQAAAFGRLMSDSRRAAVELEKRFADSAEAQIVSLCTDGETYGHHEKFADMGLAHLLSEELGRRGLKAVNYGWYLAKHPPRWHVQIKPGDQGRGTSWSCAHGVARWMEDCPCGAGPGQQTRWRRPLREALDWLGGELARVFEERASPLLESPWDARHDYARTFGADAQAEKRYWARHLKRSAVGSAGEARRLLEMQKFAMFMHTSCGWFFADVAGLEAAQNLKYAARAVELARQASGEDLEPQLLRRLALAPSNDARYGDAAGVYRRAAGAGRDVNSSRA